jgi:hypothetical protein
MAAAVPMACRLRSDPTGWTTAGAVPLSGPAPSARRPPPSQYAIAIGVNRSAIFAGRTCSFRQHYDTRACANQ